MFYLGYVINNNDKQKWMQFVAIVVSFPDILHFNVRLNLNIVV